MFSNLNDRTPRRRVRRQLCDRGGEIRMKFEKKNGKLRRGCRKLFQMHNAVADGGQNGAGAVIHRQLGKDIFEMGFDRVFRDE